MTEGVVAIFVEGMMAGAGVCFEGTPEASDVLEVREQAELEECVRRLFVSNCSRTCTCRIAICICGESPLGEEPVQFYCVPKTCDSMNSAI